MVSTKYHIHCIFLFIILLHIYIILSYDLYTRCLTFIVCNTNRIMPRFSNNLFSSIFNQWLWDELSGQPIKCCFHTSLVVTYTRFSQQLMFRVLQVLAIFESWICHIFEFFCPPKVTSTLSMRPTEHNGDVKNICWYDW